MLPQKYDFSWSGLYLVRCYIGPCRLVSTPSPTIRRKNVGAWLGIVPLQKRDSTEFDRYFFSIITDWMAQIWALRDTTSPPRVDLFHILTKKWSHFKIIPPFWANQPKTQIKIPKLPSWLWQVFEVYFGAGLNIQWRPLRPRPRQKFRPSKRWS